jgi:hypothetical protein
MTEAQSTMILKPRAVNKRAVFDMVCAALVLAFCAWGFWKGPIWPDRIGILVGPAPPTLLILLRARNRQILPDRLPARWSRTSRLEMRLTTLGWVLTVVFMFFLFPWLFMDTSRHPGADHPYLLVAFTAQIWAQFLDQYIADREHIPPPDPLVPPSMRIAGTKPFQSEHWGENA